MPFVNLQILQATNGKRQFQGSASDVRPRTIGQALKGDVGQRKLPHGKEPHGYPKIAPSDAQREHKAEHVCTTMSSGKVKLEVIVTMTGVTDDYSTDSSCVQVTLDISHMVMTGTGEIYSSR
jgi:hypothetical protein